MLRLNIALNMRMMSIYHPELLLIACVVEAIFGYPQPLFRRIGHPVTWMGRIIRRWDRRNLRPDQQSDYRQFVTGASDFLKLVILVLLASLIIQYYAHKLPYGEWLLIICMSTLIAGRSLYTHVRDVHTALAEYRLDKAKIAVGKIVGRDTDGMSEQEISRAALESLAESFSDGVVAPIFWGLVFGFPGMVIYKAINTADSMIGYKTGRYLHYGRTAARVDDLMNFIPARISGWLIALAALLYLPSASASRAVRIRDRDARLHASPNAGYPEAAMAGALGVRLGGARSYAGEREDAPWFGAEFPDPAPTDLKRGMRLYLLSYAWLWGLLAVWAVAQHA